MNRPPFTFHRMDLPRKFVKKSGTGILAALISFLAIGVSTVGWVLVCAM